MQRLFPTTKASVSPTDIYDDVHFPLGNGDRPYVALNMVSTVDGKTTLDQGRVQGPIGSSVDRALMGRLRIAVDAVMRGAGTVRKSPRYPGVSKELEYRRIERGLARQPLAIVVTASGDLPLDAPFFTDAPRKPLVIAPKTLADKLRKPLASVADTLFAGEETVDLSQAMKRLYDTYGITRLLSEGGPRLNYECVQRQLLDELFWTVAPKLAGNAADLTLVHGPALLKPLPRLQLLSAYALDGELFLRYKLMRNASPEKGAEQRE